MAFLDVTRAAYDTVAADYAAHFHNETDSVPVERAMVTAFADFVRAGGGGPIADIGCGAGIWTAYLHGSGIDVFGVDLSPGMLAQARAFFPALRFTLGSMTALAIADGSLAGVLAMYSVIHVPDAALPGVLAEFHRVLAPGGQLLLAFQDLDEHLLRTEAFGHAIALDYYFRPPERMAEFLAAAGFDVHTRVRRKAHETERTPRALLLACRL